MSKKKKALSKKDKKRILKAVLESAKLSNESPPFLAAGLIEAVSLLRRS